MGDSNRSFEREHELAAEIDQVLLRLNPMGLGSCREGEYFPEARAVAPLIPKCQSEAEVTAAVHQVFVRFFTAPYNAGPASRYERAGKEIWELWQKFRGQSAQSESGAIAELRKKAESGDQEAQLNLGVALVNGDDVARDFKSGFAWVEKAAASGYANAQFILGMMYDDGIGFSSWLKAKEWYEKAAGQGHARAQYRLGVLHSKPELNRNLQAAALWIEKAALQGNRAAQGDLGIMYTRGDGVPKDLAKAKEWLQKAAAQGNEQAQNALRRL